MTAFLFALTSSELGVSSSTLNIVLIGSIMFVIGLPLFFVARAQASSSKSAVTLK